MTTRGPHQEVVYLDNPTSSWPITSPTRFGTGRLLDQTRPVRSEVEVNAKCIVELFSERESEQTNHLAKAFDSNGPNLLGLHRIACLSC